MAAAYISIALKHPSEEHTRKGRCTLAHMGLACEASAIAGKTRVPVLTADVEVRPDAMYGELPYVRKVAAEVDFVGGVNVPKKVAVIDNFNHVRILFWIPSCDQ